MSTFQSLIQKLSDYWAKQGCAVQFGYDLEMGAGTFNPATFFRSIGPEPYQVAYVEPSRRPTDGRYGDNPSRLQHYFQFQVVMKPSPFNLQELYLGSLEAVGFPIKEHDVRFVHDDWKSPTLGAWGLGWEVQIDGMEVSQFTYFQCMGGIDLTSISGEITYGLERLAMYVQNVENVYNLKWNKHLSYGDIYHQSEIEWSTYNFEKATVAMWSRHFEDFEEETKNLIQKNLPIPAYDFVMKASHAFNLLDARGVISVTERTGYINRIRKLACQVAKLHLNQRKKIGFPLMKSSLDKQQKKHTTFHLSKFNPKQQEDFVLEIGVEELPHAFIACALKNLSNDLKALLEKESLSYETLEVYGSPRRLVALIKGLAKGIDSQKIEKKGPPISKAFDLKGHPTQLGSGFFKSLKLPLYTLKEIEQKAVSQLSVYKVSDVEYLKITQKLPPKSTKEILSKLLPPLILGLDFPKKMKWSDLQISFARPIRWLLALHGKEEIPVSIANITSEAKTYGQRRIGSPAISLKKSNDYFNALSKVGIQIDPEDRKKTIQSQLKQIEKKYQAKATYVNELLDQLVYLVEAPTLEVGFFDPKFLSAPKELLELVMVTHQRYFPLVDAKGKLLPHFVVCLDQPTHPKMIKGHERALSPRLADGLFVYDQDLNLGLSVLKEKLKQMTFQKELGTLEDKAKRLELHSGYLNRYIHASTDAHQISETAHLLKADLASHVVFEFPELQGIIGAHYAHKEKLSDFCAAAIKEHWLPRFEEDKLPMASSGVLFALADKLDNLLACFLTGLIPSSSSDPYALRRQALGIIRIVIEHKIHLPLISVFTNLAKHFTASLSLDILQKLIEFMTSRFKTILSRYHLRSDEIEAVLHGEELDFYDFYLRAKALHAFKKQKPFDLFIEVFKRTKGQLQCEISAPLQSKLFKSDAEKNLYDYLLRIKEEFQDSLEERNYEASFLLISSLQPYLGRLFDEVKILDSDEKVRLNRLALLKEVLHFFENLSDFTKLKL